MKQRTKANLKGRNGITLIALVITIIVLIILAGVSINLLLGENGIIAKAKIAREDSRGAEVKDRVALVVAENTLTKSTGEGTTKTKDAVIQQLVQNGKLTEKEATDLETKDKITIGSIEVDFSALEKSKETISKEDSFVGCFADIEGDGTIDGVIYADLAIGINIESDNEELITVTPTSANELKDYYIKEESYTVEHWGTKRVIAPINPEDTTKKDRFYVMALTDIENQTYYNGYEDYCNYTWYSTAAGTEEGISDYDTLTQIDFGAGKTNTEKIIKEWKLGTYGEKSESDMWGKISTNEDGTVKWFVPSEYEWIVFIKELNFNHETSVGVLGTMYWSSTLWDKKYPYYESIRGIFDGLGSIGYTCCVRLSTTF